MNRDELKVGYLVKFKNDKLGIVMPTYSGNVIDIEGGMYAFVNDYEQDMVPMGEYGNPEYGIMEVYGYSHTYADAIKFQTTYRDLLWERENPKEMTIKDIEKELGYKIKIVEED